MVSLEDLPRILQEKTCIVGMGNPFRNDDGVGVFICEELRAKARLPGNRLPGNIEILSVEDILESYIFQIADAQYENVLLVDAMRTGSESGTVVFGKLNEMDEIDLAASTHKLTLATTEKILNQSGKNVFFLGIAGNDLDYGNTMTDSVRESANMIIDFIQIQFKNSGVIYA